jgi:hypothetical protein
MIRPVARNNLVTPGVPSRDLDRVLNRLGPVTGEKHTAKSGIPAYRWKILRSRPSVRLLLPVSIVSTRSAVGNLDNSSRQARPRFGAPGTRYVAQPPGLLLYRPNYSGMLMTEIAAFRLAAEIQIAPALGIPEPGALRFDDGRSVPVGLPGPGVQDTVVLVSHELFLIEGQVSNFNHRTD